MLSKSAVCRLTSDGRRPSSVVCPLSSAFWHNRRVLITGHTGFKGSWLAFWLNKLGAEVHGYSLKPPTRPSHYQLLKMDIDSTIGDIRDLDGFSKAMAKAKPEIIFHLAAQPLVRLSYEKPIETFSTNVMGTLNVFEASRNTSTVRAIVNVTSDKCYENLEINRGYRETDRMGGRDPYSASKGCSELLTKSYRSSYFNVESYGKEHHVLLASCRAGNVIGGGDWAADRLIPDIMKAAAKGERSVIRNPGSVRPWQHVLEPLSGYISIGQRLLEGKKEFADAWNFGPAHKNELSVLELVKKLKACWEMIEFRQQKTEVGNQRSVIRGRTKENGTPIVDCRRTKQPHEARILLIDSTKARKYLGWKPRWDADKTLEMTVNWYRNYYENNIISTENDIEEYEKSLTTNRH